MRRLTLGTGICLLAMVLALFGARPAAAATTRSGETVLVRGGETVEGDLYAFGQTVRIAGIVNGDLIVAAQDVVITGTVNGSINGAAATITVSGTVQNAVRAATAKLVVSGTVGGDVASASGKTTVTRGAQVGGDVLLRSGDVAFRGSVGGDIRGSASSISIDAAVGGSVLVAAETITVTRNGTIAGDLKYASNNDATLFNDQSVTGQVVRTSSLRAAGGPDLFSAITSPLTRLFVGLMTGLLLVLFVPMPVIGAAEVIRTRFGGAMAMGLITVLTWPILFVLLTVIVIGIPLALIGTVLLLCIGWLSQIFVGLALGRAILPKSWNQRSRGYNILALAIGMILLGAAKMAPVPFVPAVVAVVVLMIGIGGAILAIHAGSSAIRGRPLRA